MHGCLLDTLRHASICQAALVYKLKHCLVCAIQGLKSGIATFCAGAVQAVQYNAEVYAKEDSLYKLMHCLIISLCYMENTALKEWS